MLNFEYNVPTKIYFGKGQIEKLREIKSAGTKALLVYAEEASEEREYMM